jgi:hypothetical protein
MHKSGTVRAAAVCVAIGIAGEGILTERRAMPWLPHVEVPDYPSPAPVGQPSTSIATTTSSQSTVFIGPADQSITFSAIADPHGRYKTS